MQNIEILATNQCEIQSPLSQIKTAEQLSSSQIIYPEKKYISPCRRNTTITPPSSSCKNIIAPFSYNSPQKTSSLFNSTNSFIASMAMSTHSHSSLEDNSSLKSSYNSHTEEVIDEISRLRTYSNNPLGRDRRFTESEREKSRKKSMSFQEPCLEDIMKDLEKELNFEGEVIFA